MNPIQKPLRSAPHGTCLWAGSGEKYKAAGAATCGVGFLRHWRSIVLGGRLRRGRNRTVFCPRLLTVSMSRTCRFLDGCSPAVPPPLHQLPSESIQRSWPNESFTPNRGWVPGRVLSNVQCQAPGPWADWNCRHVGLDFSDLLIETA